MRLFNKGSILFPKSGASAYLNHRVMLGIDAFVSSHLAVIEAGKKVDARYLLYSLATIDAKSLLQNAAYPSLRRGDIASIQIPLPPLADQRRIAATLDKICGIIEKRKAQLAQLQQLVKSRFVEMFGEDDSYPKEKVEDVSHRVKVAFVGSCDQFYTTPGNGVPMVRTTNLTKDGFSAVGMKYVTREFHERNKKSQLHSGDILVARHGANGRACLYDGGEANCLNVIIIEPDLDKALPLFLEYALNSDCVRKDIQRDLVGSTQHVLNTTSIAKARISLPPLALQREFAAFVAKVDRLEAAVKRGLVAAERLYRQQLQEVFA